MTIIPQLHNSSFEAENWNRGHC